MQQRVAAFIETQRSPWRWVLLPLSPTRLIAEQLIDRECLVDYRSISRWNYAFSVIAVLSCAWFVWWPSQGFPRWGIVIGSFIAWISLSRVIELVFAFYRDGIERLNAVEARTKLKSSERIGLLIRAYLELIVQFAILDYWISCVCGASAFDKPLTSIWASLYFSGITITTTGYGDLAPVYLVARASAVVEAIRGVFFIALSLAAYLSSDRDSDVRR